MRVVTGNMSTKVRDQGQASNVGGEARSKRIWSCQELNPGSEEFNQED